MKKIISLILCLVFFGSSIAFAENTEKNMAKAVFEISEVDENGFFTLDLTIYNATFKGILSALSYDKTVVVPVDFETKEESHVFDNIAVNPTSAKNIETGEEIADWQLLKGSAIKDSEISIISMINTASVYPNSIVSKKTQALADENGLKIGTFYFKRIADKPIIFDLKASDTLYGGFMLINGYGMQTCEISFDYPQNVGEDTKVVVERVVKTRTSNDAKTDEDTAEKRVKARTNGTVILAINNYATISDSVLKWIDKDNKKVVPYIKDNRTMVPLRYIAEELGCKVNYNDATREITIDSPKTELIFKIDSLTYTNDGLVQTLDTPPEIKESRTFIPLRAVAEALNKSVTWIEADKTIVITSAEYPWAEENAIEKELYARAKYLMSPMLRDMAY